jgi:hypothetical protein
MVCFIKLIGKCVIPIVITSLISCHVGNPLELETREVDYLNKTGDVICANPL